MDSILFLKLQGPAGSKWYHLKVIYYLVPLISCCESANILAGVKLTCIMDPNSIIKKCYTM